MSKRHKYTLLHVAIAACAVISVGIVSTANVIRNRQNMHRSAASEVMDVVVPEKVKQERTEAAAREKAERQNEDVLLDLRDLRMGN